MLYLQATATICDELPSDGILLIYISSSGFSFVLLQLCYFSAQLCLDYLIQNSCEISTGKTDCSVDFQKDIHGNSLNFSKAKHTTQASQKRENSLSHPAADNNPNLSSKIGHYLCLGSQGNGGIMLHSAQSKFLVFINWNWVGLAAFLRRYALTFFFNYISFKQPLS